MIEMHIPENVKLWESPGRAGGLPNCNYLSPTSNLKPLPFWDMVELRGIEPQSHK